MSREKKLIKIFFRRKRILNAFNSRWMRQVPFRNVHVSRFIRDITITANGKCRIKKKQNRRFSLALIMARNRFESARPHHF